MISNEEFEESATKEDEAGRLGFALEAVSLVAMKKLLAAMCPDLSQKEVTKIIDESNYFYEVAERLMELKK